MADDTDVKAEASAEKAYAAAAESVAEKVADEAPAAAVEVVDAAPVEFPAKPARVRKAKEAPAAAVLAPVVEETVPAPAPAPRRVRAAAAVKTPAPVKAKAVKAAAKKPVKRVIAPKPAPAAKPSPAKLRKPAGKIKAAVATAKPKPQFIAQLKELPMDMTASIKEAVSGAQTKAKDAFAKTSAFAGEYGEFTKGNVEALVQSGKILAAGLQDIGNTFIADGKAVFETAKADVKGLSSVKTPGDFLKLQTELLRRNFDSAFAYTAKTSDAVLKLTGDVIAPLTDRANLAVEKVRKAA